MVSTSGYVISGLLRLFNRTFQVHRLEQHRMIMGEKLEGMWKVVAVVCFKALSQYFTTGNEQND
jgi:hypothetical protein